MIDDRQQEIDGLYADAGNAKAQAEALQAQYDARLKAANAEGDRIIQKATRQAQEREEAIVHEAQEKPPAPWSGPMPRWSRRRSSKKPKNHPHSGE